MAMVLWGLMELQGVSKAGFRAAPVPSEGEAAGHWGPLGVSVPSCCRRGCARGATPIAWPDHFCKGAVVVEPMS